MKLQEKTLEAFNVIKANGGEMKITDLMAELGVEKIASVTGRINSLVKNELAYRREETVEGQEKPVKYVCLTDEGMSFVPTDAE